MSAHVVVPQVPLDIDRYDVYRVALQFCAFAASVRPASRELRDQLDRAAASIVLNTAEAIGRTSAADKRRIFAIARGSVLECAAVLDVLHARGAASSGTHREGRTMLVRMMQMLTRLARG